tara:strand:- start:334 stop:471 length:138 start_codon:yes stop_codon:yes gene_type:complete
VPSAADAELIKEEKKKRDHDDCREKKIIPKLIKLQTRFVLGTGSS